MKRQMRSILIFLTAMALLFSFTATHVSADDTGKGTLSVNSNPPGAEVYLNDEFVGYTDLILTELYPGIHYVRLDMPGYKSWEKIFEIKSGSTTYVSHNLEASAGESYSINTEPDGAEIYIDDEFYGYSDTVLYGIPSGQHEITLALDGYSDYRKTVYIQEDMSQSLTHVFEPLPTTGTIVFESVPTNADIYLNGEYRGRTRLTLEDVEPGTYTVLINKTGFEDWVGTVEVAKGKISDVSATLSAVKVPMLIKTVPEGAAVVFDDADFGVSPLDILAEQGTHSLTLTKFGYADLSTEIDTGYEGGEYLFELVPMIGEAISEAEEIVQANSYYNPVDAESALQKAKSYYSSGDPEEALSWAETAIRFATDIDGDGISNFADMAPDIDNRIIYASPIILIVLILSIVFFGKIHGLIRPRLEIEVSPDTGDDDEPPSAKVVIEIEGNYRGAVCTISIDGDRVDDIADTGTFDIDLSGRMPGLHRIDAKLVIAREKHGTKVVTVSKVFEIGSGIIDADDLME